MRKFMIFLVTITLCFVCLIGALSVSASKIEKTVVLDNCDSTVNWTTGIFPDKTNYIEGNACMYSKSDTGAHNAVFRNLDYSKFPEFDKAYIEFYFYIADVDNISTGPGHAQIELNSSGINDVHEIYFDFIPTKVALKSGWNYISLKLSEFQATDGQFDYSKLMGLRIYMLNKGKLHETRIDNIILTDTPKIDEVRANGIKPLSQKYDGLEYIVSENIYPPSDIRAIDIVMICIGGALLALAIAGLVIIVFKKAKRAN